VELFERIEGFFRRLEAYIDVPSNAGMTDTIVKIMAEVLFTLAIATREIKQNKASESTLPTPYPWQRLCYRRVLTVDLEKFLKKLVGRRDIEDALQRLENLTQEEVRMAVAQGLKATHSVAHAVAGIGGEVRGIGDQVISGAQKLCSMSLSHHPNRRYMIRRRENRTTDCEGIWRFEPSVFSPIPSLPIIEILTISQGVSDKTASKPGYLLQIIP